MNARAAMNRQDVQHRLLAGAEPGVGEVGVGVAGEEK